jgi:acetyl-CoA C-acetyltransferase
MTEAFIVRVLRSASGRRGGRLSCYHPVDLGAAVVDGLVDQAGIDPGLIDDVVFGCVSQAGEQSGNIARNIVLSSRLPETTPATTVDRRCGSSQQAIQFAAQAVMSGTMDIVLAGGVESMSRVPIGFAHTLPLQHGYGQYVSPGIEKNYARRTFNQFQGAEILAKKYDLSKDELDLFGFESQRKAMLATRSGRFRNEILPLPVTLEDSSTELHGIDEGIRLDATLEATRGVEPMNPEGGLLSAATSSQISDGAAAMLIVNETGLKKVGLEPLAIVRHMSVLAGDPVVMLEVPIAATQAALKKSGMALSDIDLYEVNEAFACVPLAWAKALSADTDRLNVNGGAIALGHPLGASGARLMATLVHALHDKHKRYGLQTMCEGGGQANVTIVERL